MSTTSESFQPETREQIEKVEWFGWEDAQDLLGYRNLRDHIQGLGPALREIEADMEAATRSDGGG